MNPQALCRDYAETPVFLPGAPQPLPLPLPGLRIALRIALSLFPRATQRWLYKL